MAFTVADSTLRSGGSGTTSTITGVPFGTAAADRLIAVFLQPRVGSGAIIAATIAGVAATLVGTGNTSIPTIAIAAVPTGTSGSIVVTLNASDQAECYCVINITGMGASPSIFDSAANTGNSSSVNVAAGGLVLANITAYSSGAGSWTGATQRRAWDSSSVGSVATFESASAVTGKTISYSTADGIALMSLAPASSSTTLTGTLFTDSDSFGAGTVTPGAVTLVGALFSDADSFGAGAVSPGPVTVTGTLYSETDTFGAGAVSTSITIAGTLFSETDQFGAGTVSPGVVTLGGTTFEDPDAFGAGSIIVEGGTQTVIGALFAEPDSFGQGAVVGGGAEIPLEHGGGGYISDPYRRGEVKAEDRKRLRAIIEKAMADPSEEAEQLQELVEPAVTYEGERVTVDWGALVGQLDAIARAANAYLAALEQAEADFARQAQQVAFEQDEDDVIALLLAA